MVDFLIDVIYLLDIYSSRQFDIPIGIVDDLFWNFLFICNKQYQTIFSSHCSFDHHLVLSLFVTYHWVCNNSNTTGATCGAGMAHPSKTPEFTPVFLVELVLLDFSFLCNILWIVDCPFSFCHCVVCSSIDGFWLPLWYLKAFLQLELC